MIRVGVIGTGAAALTAHLPALAASPRFELAATSELVSPLTGVPLAAHKAVVGANARR